ncbi:uncharacterized protein KY384_004309 [Bacidia gigantensis]|uniref:uncharacterized protein n=1 Tax=Bacidia gigantensis TaxID=2732470 RepID=UPI001D0514E5|nr:uncharacterized protein KY384_004309 [Bacidia gigantensis]KAG8530952.1 hypothetical protein KY384_004309 [Bacidia gigantensis]
MTGHRMEREHGHWAALKAGQQKETLMDGGAHDASFASLLWQAQIFSRAIAALGAGFSYIGPRRRPFNITDPEISFPHTEETVSSWVLFIVSVLIPAAIIFAVSLLLGPGSTAQKPSTSALLRRKVWEWHAGWMGLALASAITFAITNGTKEVVGKPRPDLLSRCKPDLSRILDSAAGAIGDQVEEGIILVTSEICRGSGFDLDEGFRSFPSGHSSTAFAGLTYLALWLSAKLGIAIPVLRSPALERGIVGQESKTPCRSQGAAPPIYLLIFPLIPLATAIFIASSRYSDFRHHGFDVVSGSILGIACAWLGFRWYHLPIRRGGGWAWAPRSPQRAFIKGVGVSAYADDESTVVVDEQMHSRATKPGGHDVAPTRAWRCDGETDSLQKKYDTFSKAPESRLFPKVDPTVDGEDCDHDCASCEVHLPRNFKVEETRKLYGHVKPWATHMLVATGKSDWVGHVEGEKDSVMEAVKYSKIEPSNGKLMISASNMPMPEDASSQPPADRPTSVLLLPAFTIVENVSPSSVPDLIRLHVSPSSTTTTPLGQARIDLENQSDSNWQSTAETPPITPPISSVITTPFTTRPYPHKYLILLCSHRTRDARCGQSAPLLRREFERHLRPLGLYRDLHDERPGGVGVYFVSHIGGHKFSANVMVYRRAESGDGGGLGEASQCIWLARVRPEDCEGVVRFTVLQGKVVKPERQLRGGFDREKGLSLSE